MNTSQFKIDINKAICRLLPFYLRGRRIILFLEGIAKPLDNFNNGENSFASWADKTLLSASMSAQPMRLEWYLNHLYKEKWQLKSNITVTNYAPTQTVIYRRDECSENGDANGKNTPLSPNMIPLIVYTKDERKHPSTIKIKEEVAGIGTNVLINIPKITNASLDVDKCVKELQNTINKYMPIGATYLVRTTR